MSPTFQELQTSLFGRIEGRLERFHMNSDGEAERCSLGRLCLGEHFDSAEDVDEAASATPLLEGAFTSPNAVGSRMSRRDALMYSADLRDRLHRKLLKMYSQAAEKGTHLGRRGFISIAEIGLREDRFLFTEQEILDCIDGKNRRSAKTHMHSMADAGYFSTKSSMPAGSGSKIKEYFVNVGRITCMESYSNYLESLGILDELLEDPLS